MSAISSRQRRTFLESVRLRAQPLLKKTWEVVSAVSVRVKILGMMLGLVLLLGAGVTWQVRNSLTSAFYAQLENESITTARDLAARAADPILINDLVGLQRLLLETQENNPDVRYAFIVDKDGQVLAHTFGSGFPLALLRHNQAAPGEHHRMVVLETESGLVWDTAVPVFEGRAGTVRIGISDARLRATIHALTLQLILMVVLVSTLGVLVAVFLTFVLTRPINDLVQATRRVAQGDFSPRVPRWADDEIGDLAEAFNAMTAELARADEIRREREQLRRQLLEKVIATQEDERRRIARELHDSTSQNLTSLMVGLKHLETLCDNPRVRLSAEELRGVTARTLEEVHEISARLRPRLLDDLGLAAALERLAHEWQARHKIPLDLLIHIGEERLPVEIETAIYRIVQESLTNVARHAGARSVSVLVERRGGDVIALIEDDGCGFDPAQSPGERRLGLAGMRERAELLGGQLTVESQPGRGTSIHVQIPIRNP
ncbi:MAG: HAMP domain-containing protein [Anaerolineales bacterium]|nr:HAMP domain-containing protein [Anaerolineales bacterium]MCX7756162.1 HAMP domain-containing protein [Anaerolineales bacterium]